jgi:hypothetical protein
MCTDEKYCLTCQQLLNGRIDKKFCDDYCRSAFNNKKYVVERGIIRQVNHLLLRNRKILEACLSGSVQSIHVLRQELSSKGFQFDFFTHSFTTADGKKYCCCYDHAYSILSHDEFIIIKLSKKNTHSVIPCNESLPGNW